MRYCSYDDYLPWIERWREVVAPVVAAAPARPAGLAITQLPGTEEVLASMQLYGGTRYGLVRRYDRMRARAPFRGSGAIHPRLQWGRHEKEGEFGLGLALAVAGRATGIRTHFRLAEADLAKLPRRARRPGVVGRLGRRVTECATLEQGRAVVALWLAAQATPATEAAYRRAARGLPYQVPGPDVHTFYPPVNYVLDEYDYDALGWPGFGAQWGTREAAYATQLLERDDAAVRAELRAHWERLTDPRTTTDEAARMLGLERVPSLERVVEASDMSLARDVFYLPFCR